MIARGLICMGLMLVGLGCSNTNSSDNQAPLSNTLEPVQTNAYDMPPAELLAAAKSALTQPPFDLKILDEKDGVILTDWKEYEGRKRFITTWPERTRYRIWVVPDAQNPTKRSRLEASQQTQSHATGSKVWKNDPEYDRPDRAKDLLTKLREKIGTGATATKPS